MQIKSWMMTGLLLAHLLSACGWFQGTRRGDGWLATGLRAATWGAGALLLQPLAIVVAAGWLLLGASDAARLWLTHGIWMVAFAAALPWLWRADAGASLLRSVAS